MIKLYLLMLLLLPLSAKELFLKEDISSYLTKDNPYFYNSIGKIFVRESEEQIALGRLDTRINAKYDNKNYPTTEGTYQYASISQPLLNDIELSLSYRNAQGIQEYNNIKTGQDGEILAGIKIPLFSLLNDISQNKVNIDLAKISTQYEKESSRVNINVLYMKIFKAYYQILLYKAFLHAEKELFSKAKENKKLISKQIKVGKLPQIALAEVEALNIEREQRFLYAKNNFLYAKNIFLQYLGISHEDFTKRYKFPSLTYKLPSIFSFKNALNIAKRNRPELKQITFKEQENSVKKEFNTLEKYPKFNIGLYGNYDMIYNEGYKVTFDFSLPLERRKFKGRDEALQKEALIFESQKLTLIREIKTTLKNILQKMKMIKETIKLSKKELTLSKKVEKAEKKKLKQGVSTILFVNQREMKTLQTQQKLLKYYYELLLLGISLDYELGIHSKQHSLI